MDTNLVSYSQYQLVYDWATANGYAFSAPAGGKGANQPVYGMILWDLIIWCNARSQQAGLTPVYYTDTNFTQLCTNDVGAAYSQLYAPYPNVNWAANGYRLPTEAEWEKAARGGVSGQRFPWGDMISESQANYIGDPASDVGYS
jgi:formylglycine-generating enzyme required for sulfatase activity